MLRGMAVQLLYMYEDCEMIATPDPRGGATTLPPCNEGGLGMCFLHWPGDCPLAFKTDGSPEIKNGPFSN